MLEIAIITRAEAGSPKVLAECLDCAIKEVGHQSTIFLKINALKRLMKFQEVKKKYNLWLWNLYKGIHALNDRLFLQALKKFDAIIISDCIPLGFYKDSYSIERLKTIISNTPILIYEVYYLGNAPTIINELKSGGHPTMERYDWHLSVSEVSEIRQKPSSPWSQIGLFLKSTGLKPTRKEGLLAIIDFARPGHEDIRNTQIKILEELGVPYISFERRFSIEEIRAIYKRATFYFMQSLEAYGVPIAECLSCGSYIFTPNSSWPMSWRLDEKPQIHGPGKLSDCFVVYEKPDDLRRKLKKIIAEYDPEKTPKKVFKSFMKDYPSFYEGNLEALKEVLDKMEKGTSI